MQGSTYSKVITAENYTLFNYLKRVWEYRSLIRILSVRSINVQYSQTLLGLLWVGLQPIISVIIYTVFFYQILGITAGKFPYPVFVLTGILGWFNFSKTLNEAGMSLQNHQDLIRKIEFPKLVLPISKVIYSLVDVAVIFFITIALIVYYKIPITINIIFFPFFVLLNQIVALAIALWLNILTIRFRDFNHFIPYLVGFGIWITPVFYPTTVFPEKYEQFIYLNPVACVIAGFRWSLLGDTGVDWLYVFGLVPVLLLFVSGLYFFVKIDSEIADYI